MICKFTKKYPKIKPNDFLKTTLTDIKVKLADEFDRNFERKAFFDKKWKDSKFKSNKGSLMMRSGKLRRSIKSKITTNGIEFTSSMPYADIHNNGGTLIVTAKMKRFFWAMYYESAGAITKTKKGTASKSNRNVKLSQEAQKWKNMALMKVGTKMNIEQRQFIGQHPKVDTMIKNIIKHNLNELEIKPFK